MLRLVLVVALVLTGCASDSPETSGDSALADPAPTVEAAPDAPADAPPEATLALAMNGLGLADFGTTMEEAVAAVAALQGNPADTGENPECGAGPLTFASWGNGLTLYGSEGAFVGWFLSDGPVMTDLATPDDLALGSTRADLDAATTADVSESTIGTEFYAVASGGDPATSETGLSGLLTGDGPDAEIEAMWAGTTCIFR